MLNAVLWWAIQQASGFLLHKIAVKLGVEKAAEHAAGIIAKVTPLPEDPLPSPAELRRPKQPWLR